MSRNVREIKDFSAWTGGDKEAATQLVPVNPPKRLEVNGAAIIEQSHECVIGERDG